MSRQLTALVRRRRGGGPGTCAPTLRRVVVDASHDDRVNVVVVLDCRGRIVPVAVEVADRDGTWQVSALGAPQDHRPGDRDHHRPDWEQPASVEPW